MDQNGELDGRKWSHGSSLQNYIKDYVVVVFCLLHILHQSRGGILAKLKKKVIFDILLNKYCGQ